MEESALLLLMLLLLEWRREEAPVENGAVEVEAGNVNAASGKKLVPSDAADWV